MKKIVNALSTLGLLAALSGCSVGMAMSGQDTPDLSVIRPGATRSEVELQLKDAIHTHNLGSDTICTYYYKVGAEKSPGRAIGHGVMDVLTVGLWEVVGTPVEAASLGDKYELTAIYDTPTQTLKHFKSQKL